MSKLFRLKEWLTLEEVSRHLSDLYGEYIAEADLLRLALDGHLALSVRFVNHASARVGKVVPLADAKRFCIPSLTEGEWFHGIEGLSLGDGRVVELGAETISIREVWDLAMVGAERLDVEHRYQALTGGPGVELVCLDGTVVFQGDLFAQLQSHFADNELFDKDRLKSPYGHPENWFPAGGLPDDSVFVIRHAALEGLKAHLTDPVEGGEPAGPSPIPSHSAGGGRPMSGLWPDWVAELAALVHDEGLPAGEGAEGVDQIISAVSDRLADRGLEGPTRSTVQKTARATLHRLRGAGN